MLYGRDAERILIGDLLEAARASRSGALVVRGEAGVGKTALLEDTRERAADMQVLFARGIESESELPFAALHQLVRPALGLVGELPEPQARALRGALGLADEVGQERFLVYAACLTLLSELSERRPVLCLVDDAHWLDTASADALRFVARRLDAEGILLLFGAREGEACRFDVHDVPSLMLGGLDREAANAVLARAAATAVPAVRELLVAHTQGNALALVELPAALTEAQLTGDEALPEALPMTRQLESVFHARVAQLPEQTRLLLLVAAADGSEDLGLIIRAGTLLGADPYGLDPAEKVGLVSVRGTRIAFRHPLVRSAVYGAATSSERRAAHRALADASVGDAEQADRRAWHLAASAVDHDDDVVDELDKAAWRAEERGGHIAAARALERAAELSLDPVGRNRRFVRAARDLSLAGRDEQAVALAERVVERTLEPVLRAELARLRAAAAIRRGRPSDGVPELVSAAAELVTSEPSIAIELVMHATVAGWQGAGANSSREIAGVLSAIPQQAVDEPSRVIADSIAGFAAMINGNAADAVPRLAATVAWGARTREPRHVLWAAWAAVWLGDEHTFEALLDRAAKLARALGEVGTLADVLGTRAVHLALFAQRYDEASIAANEGLQLGRELNAENIVLLPRSALAIVAAVRGRDSEACELCEQVLDLARSKEVRLRASPAVYALAMVDMGRARWADALERLASLTDPADPAVAITAPDRIEAAVRAGRLEQAQATLELYAAWAGYSGTQSTHPRLASCRALLAEGEVATRHFEEAIGLIADARPFDRPRIHLLFGEHLRRGGHRLDAREHLRAAIDGFEGLGAEPWAERAAYGDPRIGRDRAQTRSERGRAADSAGAPDRPPRFPGTHQQGSRCGAVPVATNDRRTPAWRLCQARYHVAEGAAKVLPPERGPCARGHRALSPFQGACGTATPG